MTLTSWVGEIMATCANCGVSTRVIPNAMWVEPVLIAKPLGTFSLSGAQMKVSAYEQLRLFCRCGWSIGGYYDFDEQSFVGIPETQEWPDGPPFPCRATAWYHGY